MSRSLMRRIINTTIWKKSSWNIRELQTERCQIWIFWQQCVMQKQEIGASLQCLSRKEGVPNVIVNFDVFNRNRKWSDEDITLLTILGHCIGNLLNYSE